MSFGRWWSSRSRCWRGWTPWSTVGAAAVEQHSSGACIEGIATVYDEINKDLIEEVREVQKLRRRFKVGTWDCD
jgi:hypothetical protein